MTHRYNRRAVLRTTTLAAGLVWTRPVVRTAALVGAAGTPPPQTSSTMPNSRVVTFSGVVNTSQGGLASADDCPGFVLDVIGTADLDGLGLTDLKLSPCFVFPGDPEGGFHSTSGHIVLAPPGGTLVGTVSGTLRPPPTGSEPVYVIEWDLELTSGTGDFAGAAGTGAYEGTQLDIGQTVGTLRGTVEIPDG